MPKALEYYLETLGRAGEDASIPGL